MKFVNPDEAIKRLAAAQGIDYLNLIKSQEQMQQESEQQNAQAMNQAMVGQAGSLASSPLMDPTKNPTAKEDFQAITQGMGPPTEE